MKMNNKGVTLIELIVSFAIVGVAIIYFFQTLYTVKKIYSTAQSETNDYVKINYTFRVLDALVDNGKCLVDCDSKIEPFISEDITVNNGSCNGNILSYDVENSNKIRKFYKYVDCNQVQNTITKNSLVSEEMIKVLDENGENAYIYSNNKNNYNNWVLFANIKWRIVRLNVDDKNNVGSIRIITAFSQGNSKYNSNSFNYKNMYFSESDTIKNFLENWYNQNLKEYDDKILNSSYCEAAKVLYNGDSSYDGWMMWNNMTNEEKLTLNYYENDRQTIKYNPSLQCITDKNNKGIINSKIGLLTIDEALLSGSNFPLEDGSTISNTTYLNSKENYWLMSPLGFNTKETYVSGINQNGILFRGTATSAERGVRPVITLDKTVYIKSGNGTEDDPYVLDFSS